MSIERARGRRGTRFAGGLIAAAPVLAAAIAMAYFRLDLPGAACAFHHWTGLPCATCGSTRMLRAALSGRLLEALSWNPLVFCGLSVIAPWTMVSGLRLLADRPVWCPAPSPRVRAWLAVAAAGAVVANWAYLILCGI